ncbi:circularly permuted type 2 ATP-grasp protein, partial [Paracoccaceae bacterium]|nr:circularly permuted type 2 ATP-grasp protein [Paracoccaceae bacterium]
MSFFDEMFADSETIRICYRKYHDWLNSPEQKNIVKRKNEAENVFRRTGITFNVYNEKEETEKLIPFDLIPRILGREEWKTIKKGVEQRVKAINSFLFDIYHQQEIIKAGIIPDRLINQNDAFLPEMIGFTPPNGIYTHIAGIDLVRTSEKEFLVLEDNVRTPSGVSYMIENRETMYNMFPELFSKIKVRSVTEYPSELINALKASHPHLADQNCTVAVLTPGIYNSAYFEHAFLADQMGVELVESQDLQIVDGKVAMRTTQGYKTIDVLYRRVDDMFLDPL